MTAKKKNGEASFEEELARLEALAEEMEKGELPLDALMDAYEEGAKLAGALEKRLDAAKARLSEVRTGRNGNLEITPSAIAAQGDPTDEAEPET
jgi:exodeoxyribonuclease VII small subunit